MKHIGKVCRGYSRLTLFLCTQVFSLSSLLIFCIVFYLDVLKGTAAMCFIICKCFQHHSLEYGGKFYLLFSAVVPLSGKEKKKKKNLILYPTSLAGCHLWDHTELGMTEAT